MPTSQIVRVIMNSVFKSSIKKNSFKNVCL